MIMSKAIQFYTNPMSRGQIARWMLHEAGADYDQHLLDYESEAVGSGMKSADYLAINPMGKVPAIVHNGQVITECAAICCYLAEAFPDAGLAPNDDERAAYYRGIFLAAGPLEQAIIDRHLGLSPTAEQERMAGYGNFDRIVDVLASLIADRDYVCGDRFTAADVYVGSQVDWGLQFGTLATRPEFESYAGRLRARSAYQAAKAVDGKLIAEAEQK